MSETETISQQEAGFEFKGKFFPWKLSDTGKDLLLIDRITGVPVDEFFAMVEDDDVELRGSILLAMIATSLRAGNPTWSVERIYRTVMDLSLGEIEMLGLDDEGGEVPPTQLGDESVEETSSPSPVVESSPSPTPEVITPSET